MRNICILVFLSSFFSLPLYAYAPTRQQVIESVVINAPVDRVWELVGDFSGLHKWHPAIQSTEMKGEYKRILSLSADKKITEWLINRDAEKMKLKFKITHMSVTETFEFAGRRVEREVLPVNTYTALLSVSAEGEGSKVTWKGEFYRPYLLTPPTPEGMSDKDATGTISSVYRAGLDHLKVLFEQGGTDAVAVTKIKSGDDAGNPYQVHVRCTDGKKCKIDKYLLKGFRAFSQCQVCHGIDGDGSTIAPSLLETLKKDLTYDIFIDRVSNGYQGQMGVMPPWKTNPNVMKYIDNLYAYLKARSDGVLPPGRLKRFKH